MKNIFKTRFHIGQEMRFCPECGAKLSLKQTNGGNNSNRLKYWCSKCGYIKENKPHIVEPNTTDPNKFPEKVVVIDKEALQLRTMPTTRVECAKCHNMLAYIWQVQTRSADEGSTQFFRCTKCDYTWRLYT